MLGDVFLWRIFGDILFLLLILFFFRPSLCKKNHIIEFYCDPFHVQTPNSFFATILNWMIFKVYHSFYILILFNIENMKLSCDLIHVHSPISPTFSPCDNFHSEFIFIFFFRLLGYNSSQLNLHANFFHPSFASSFDFCANFSCRTLLLIKAPERRCKKKASLGFFYSHFLCHLFSVVQGHLRVLICTFVQLKTFFFFRDKFNKSSIKMKRRAHPWTHVCINFDHTFSSEMRHNAISIMPWAGSNEFNLQPDASLAIKFPCIKSELRPRRYISLSWEPVSVFIRRNKKKKKIEAGKFFTSK